MTLLKNFLESCNNTFYHFIFKLKFGRYKFLNSDAIHMPSIFHRYNPALTILCKNSNLSDSLKLIVKSKLQNFYFYHCTAQSCFKLIHVICSARWSSYYTVSYQTKHYFYSYQTPASFHQVIQNLTLVKGGPESLERLWVFARWLLLN